VTRLAAALFACMVLFAAGGATGETQRKIVVLQADQELFRAIVLALSPWEVEATQSEAPLPPASQPEAVQIASQLARELEVEAVVWVSSAERGSLLWVYDTRAGDITTRVLPETPPFDSAAAAAVALSVKTVLRSSVVAPPAERFGARPAKPLPPPPPPPPPAERVFALELGAGGNWVAEGQSMLRFELASVAWILAARRLGVALEASTGPSLPIDDASFRGRYREIVAGAKARFRVIHESDVSVAVALGGALHFTTLEGALVESSLERSVSRLNASLDFETSLSLRISRATYLGASLGVAYSPTYRRYLVEGEAVFSPWPLAVGFGGHCGVELF
jgi:hypothetical protein